MRGHWPACLWIVITLAALFGAAAPAQADEPLTVEAHEFSAWDGARLFVAEGNVTVRYGGAVITADSLRYDVDAQLAVFSGNVVYADDERELRGRQLAYDLDKGVAVFDDLDAVLYSEGVDGPMYVRGDRVTIEADFVRVEGGRLTTCECDTGPPAYHFSARELVIYPGDRLIVRGVVFHEHGVPLLYWPYLVLSLKEDASRFDVPQIGYSSRTGWYVKLTYNYVLASGLYGALLFDYYQRLGPGAGVRHTYVDNETGRGVVSLYGVRNEYGGADGSIGWERRWTLPPWTIEAKAGYDFVASAAGIERHEVSSGATVSYRDERGTFAAEVEHAATLGSEYRERIELNGDLARRLGGGWNLRLSGEYFDERVQTLSPRRWLGYDAELSRAASRYTLALRAAQQVNPDLKSDKVTTPPTWQNVSYLPEVQLQLRRVAGIDWQLTAARLQEEPSKVTALRGQVQASLPTRTWRLGRTTTATFSGSLLGRAYSTGHRQLTAQSRVGLNVQLAQPLSASLQYNYRDVWGETPFRFDRTSPSETVSLRLNWRSPSVTASASTSYNRLTERWSRVTVNAAVRAAENLLLRAAGTYDVYERSLVGLVGTLEWRPADEWTIRVGGQYNVPKEQWERVDVDLQAALGGGWKAGVTAIYDVTKMTFSRNHLYVAHDADCREIRLRWDQAKGEVWLEYHITAFPSSRVAVGTGEDNRLLFDADVLSDLLSG